MASVLKHFYRQLAALLVLTSLLVPYALPAHAGLGDRVVNVATVTYEDLRGPLTIETNEAAFTIEALRTVSTIEFFRYAPVAPDAFLTRINGSDYSPTGSATGPFDPIGPPVTAGGVVLDLTGAVSLVPTATYLSGELMIVRVIDAGQNGDPSVVETVVVTLTADNGDMVTLRLYESGADTGEFYAYLPSSRDATPQNDPVITAPEETQLTATYVDAFDSTEVSVDTALVDPFGRVFDSLTGDLVDGATVTIVDAITGLPAAVFGIDGTSFYPSTIVTGSVVTDASGLQYTLQQGEFLFPMMMPGDYRILVMPPTRYSFPSSVPEEAFPGLANAPFEIIDGSYGGVFTVLATGPLNFDVPLDPAGELVVTKRTNEQTAAIGDFIGYTITIENQDVVAAALRLQDTLPKGLRYRSGSARRNNQPIPDPVISADGRELVFTAGFVTPGETVRLSYLVEIGAGTPIGDAVNAAVAVNAVGAPISNRAEAAIFIREDLLRSRLTIIGRVAENACNGDEDWAKELKDGLGVANVRLYMETGDYVVTDADGLFHFEGIKPGTHVVQVDTETLPPGYEPMVCEENSRYAGSAISKFIDAQGGTIWRANFYLKRVEIIEEEEKEAAFDDATEYLVYDAAWLEGQSGEIEWLYPDTELTPSNRSVNIGIKHGQRQTVSLVLNGTPVPGVNFAGRDASADGSVEISRWRGVDILSGTNLFEAHISNADGVEVAVLEKTIWFVKDILRATLVDDQSLLVADGRMAPVIAVRIEDAAGRPVHSGRILDVDLEAPYELKDSRLLETLAPTSAATAAHTGAEVGPGGIALIELQPTLQTGLVRLTVRLDDGRKQIIEAYLRPEKRDWIIVGLADGALGVTDTSGLGAGSLGGTGSDLLNEGRLAFFAKGVVRGDWLLTLAVDTAKRRGDRDDQVFADIDPNAYYTLYGDRTWQDQDAESRYPVYVKLEKDTFQLLFGDYDTGLTETVLGRYSRRLSGLQAIHEGKNTSMSVFAAETNQGFAKDELVADGTSGPYQLTHNQLLRNSEHIRIETRDRFRPDQVVNVQTMIRYVDYEIDFDLGLIIFRHPVNATDASFNTNVIVAEYETSAATERNVTFGGRVAVRTDDGRTEIGLTHIREEGDDVVADATSALTALDLRTQIGHHTEVHAEYARSTRESNTGTTGNTDAADAYLLELVHQREALSVTAYLREDEEGFGLGQQSSAAGGVRRYGASATFRLGSGDEAEATQRTERLLETQIYHEKNLVTDATRIVGDLTYRQDSQIDGLSAGLRAVEEDFEDGEARSSVLVTGSLRKTFPAHGLTLSVTHEQPIYDQNETTLFPQRTIFGADKTLGEKATLNFRHERQNGENASGNTSVVGVTVKPWAGSEVRVAADSITQDGSQRIGTTVGVDQLIRIDDKWSTSFGAARRDSIKNGDDVRDVAPDDALSPLEAAPVSPLILDEAYTSGYAGLAYEGDKMAASARLEARDAVTGQRYAAVFGGAREASKTFSYAGTARAQYESNLGQPDRRSLDVRLGTAWRPRGEGIVVYDRVDIGYDEAFSQSTTWKAVNNLGVNVMLSDRTQVAAFHGVKYTEADIGGVTASGVTQLVGGEIRHDITKRLDIGLTGSALFAHSSDTIDYSFGPSIGYTPAKNVWISAGYNVEGFVDKDFEAAEYSRQGVYVKLRFKFDQDTARELLRRISPGGN